MKNEEKQKVLIAGAGGILGREIVNALSAKGVDIIGLGYSEAEFKGIRNKLVKAITCDVTKPGELKGACLGADILVSVIGITRIKNNLTHMDVDYQGNLNLLKEAIMSGVKKFVFISPAGVDRGYRYVPLFEAKYLFEEELKRSGIDWLIFRSGGFFSDLFEMGKMAQKGRMFIIGRGDRKFTPVDVRDLAEIMAEDTLRINNSMVEVGGPEDLTWKDICNRCFIASGKKPRIIFVPVWMCKFVSSILRPFSRRYHAMARLLIFTSTHDLTTASRGKRRFIDYLNSSYSK